MSKGIFSSTTRVREGIKNAQIHRPEDWKKALQSRCGLPRLGGMWFRDVTPGGLEQLLLNAEWEYCPFFSDLEATEYFKARLPFSPGLVDIRSLPSGASVTLRCWETDVNFIYAEYPRVLVPDVEFTVVGLHRYGHGTEEMIESSSPEMFGPRTPSRVFIKNGPSYEGRQCSGEEAWELGLTNAHVSA